MDDQAWLRIKELFQAGIDLPLAEQESFVRAKSQDPAVREEVLRLLAHHHSSKGFLDPIFSVSESRPASTDTNPRDPLIGRRLGDFRITRRLGAGGMGVIYEAQQDCPDRRAAIKILRMDLISPTMMQRLEEEARILAKLQHPGIAQVIAAGQADLGLGLQPWFAMEYVDGMTLNEYAKTHVLSIEKKLALLLQIGDAVEHAHQRGILHRDLKPDNILIVDSTCPKTKMTNPPIKILDFGIARSMNVDAQSSRLTMAGDLIGTLDYMSPEQFAGLPELLAARCDVFALGTIGFELLAGQLPHQRSHHTLSQLARQSTQLVSNRLSNVQPSLRGDLDVIFAKALASDPEARYQSVLEMTADIRRYLACEPVLAREPTTWYRIRKFAKRNQILVGGVTSTMLVLIFGLVMYAREANRARLEAVKANQAAAASQYEADKAQAINNFMTNDFMMNVLTAAHSTNIEDRLPVVQIVREAAANIGTTFQDEPKVEAAVRNEIGTIYYNLSEFEAAATEFENALKLWTKHLGSDHSDTLKAQNNLALTWFRQQKLTDAEGLFRQALSGRERILGPNDPLTLVTMNNLASVLRAMQRPGEAEAMLRQALDRQSKFLGEHHKDTLATMANLGSMLSQQGNLDAALEIHRRVYELSSQTLGATHVTTLQAGSILGLSLHKMGRDTEARAILIFVLANLEKTYGPNHGNTIVTRRTLARVHRVLGQTEEARLQLTQSLEIARQQSPIPDGTIKSIERELANLDK